MRLRSRQVFLPLARAYARTCRPADWPAIVSEVKNLTTARRLNSSPCHALRSPSRLPRMRIRCVSLVELPRSMHKRTRRAVACPQNCRRHASATAQRYLRPPTPPSSPHPIRCFAAAAHTSYALLRTTQAHRDTPTAANHPRPRRPTDRLCNGQCTSNSVKKKSVRFTHPTSHTPRVCTLPTWAWCLVAWLFAYSCCPLCTGSQVGQSECPRKSTREGTSTCVLEHVLTCTCSNERLCT